MNDSQLKIKELLGFNLKLAGLSYEEIVANIVTWSGLNESEIKHYKPDERIDRSIVMWASQVGKLFVKIAQRTENNPVIMIHETRDSEGYSTIFAHEGVISVDDLRFFKKTYQTLLKRLENQ